jgi:hypothetical protein
VRLLRENRDAHLRLADAMRRHALLGECLAPAVISQVVGGTGAGSVGVVHNRAQVDRNRAPDRHRGFDVTPRLLFTGFISYCS